MSVMKAIGLFFYAVALLVLTVGCVFVASAADTQQDRAASKMVQMDPASTTYAADKTALCTLIVSEIRADTLRRASMESSFQPKSGTLVNDAAFSDYVNLTNLLTWENKIYYDNCLCD